MARPGRRKFFTKMQRSFGNTEKKLRSAKYLEDVNKLQNLRLPAGVDISVLNEEERSFYEERAALLQKSFERTSKLLKQKLRELRTKRRRHGKAGRHRTHGKQPRYFNPHEPAPHRPSRLPCPI